MPKATLTLRTCATACICIVIKPVDFCGCTHIYCSLWTCEYVPLRENRNRLADFCVVLWDFWTWNGSPMATNVVLLLVVVGGVGVVVIRFAIC